MSPMFFEGARKKRDEGHRVSEQGYIDEYTAPTAFLKERLLASHGLCGSRNVTPA